MSTASILKDYVRYNHWANTNLCDFLPKLDPSWLDKEVISSFSSIRKTFYHIRDAEHVWLSRLNGTSPGDFLSNQHGNEVHPSVLAEQSEKFLAFIEKQMDSFFETSTSFKTFDGTAYTQDNWSIIMHVMNHSSFHRGQIVTQIRSLGYKDKLPRTDMVIYTREKNSKI